MNTQEAQYIQDNWPMNQSDSYLQDSSVLINLYYIHQTLLLQCVRSTEGLGTRLISFLISFSSPIENILTHDLPFLTQDALAIALDRENGDIVTL